MEKSDYHEPVMVREMLEALHVQNKAYYIDATVGSGGHSVEIINAGGRVLGIDLDPEMLEVANERLKEVCSNEACPTSFRLVCGNFRNIDRIARENGFDEVSGILFDLGISNIHLASPERGFSFGEPDAPLDMRLGPETQGVTGADLLGALRKDQLEDLFEVTLDPGSSRWLSKKIVTVREINPIKTVGDFLEVCGGLRAKPGLNPATLPFLALRIAVNSELENLEEALPKAFELLEPGGRLVVISFHSGEDRIIKNFFKEKEGGARILTGKPATASSDEISKNTSARSAKMRVLEKV